MGRKPEGDRALTDAERQARLRVKKHTQSEVWRKALEEIATVRHAYQAREIARQSLPLKPKRPLCCRAGLDDTSNTRLDTR